MENKNYLHIPSINNSTINTKTSPLLIPTRSSLDHRRSTKPYSETLVISPSIANKPLGEAIKQEKFDNNSLPKTNPTQFPPSILTTAYLNSREALNGLSFLPMTNAGSHLMSTLNPAHLNDGSGSYFVTGPNDMSSNFKLNPSSNTDIPSPSSSSNSSNPPSSSHHHHHPTRRHGEGGGDPSRKREMRLQKNREAARECRRKKKEYIKCLEERVAGLETQNKALIEELRRLKELYCQREETNKKK